ncbi:UNVERIFIED_CONTAM: hypothetical protein GTU68_017585 [Idotea baltica]|nr:hypothetical protein [Idotea baltica]
MARLLGVEIPNDKRIEASLPYVFGIGRKTSSRILEEAGVDKDIRTAITGGGVMIEGDLRRELQGHLKRLTSVNCYRGYRHRRGLPVRGQRTKTNARTRKGRRKTVGVVRK